ncbi:unnamed protein product [Fusarium venenatum]|uniref:Uncharacterized protein n=1 Tax=Fusarium venenatum TaxID=56646 RepID=A0A2L2TBF0_9HYPO|nr:uncharacterized protein FVRRES_03900 [Fusarium venenatum]CEI67388.1 unnamed protein product [Fusarium venenatum]
MARVCKAQPARWNAINSFLADVPESLTARRRPLPDPTSRSFDGQDDGEKFTMGDGNLDLEVIMVAVVGFEGK